MVHPWAAARPRVVRAVSFARRCSLLLVAPLVFRAPSGPAAREIATREPDGSEWSISKPARALRTLRRPPHRRHLRGCVSVRTTARPRRRPRAPQPGPPATSVSIASGVRCCLWCRWCSGRRRARPPARSPHASLTARSGRSRSPPVPSGPSGILHAGGAIGIFDCACRSRVLHWIGGYRTMRGGIALLSC